MSKWSKDNLPPIGTRVRVPIIFKAETSDPELLMAGVVIGGFNSHVLLWLDPPSHSDAWLLEPHMVTAGRIAPSCDPFVNPQINFVEPRGYWASPHTLKPASDGATCRTCKRTFSEVNTPDGVFQCWSCSRATP